LAEICRKPNSAIFLLMGFGECAVATTEGRAFGVVSAAAAVGESWFGAGEGVAAAVVGTGSGETAATFAAFYPEVLHRAGCQRHTLSRERLATLCKFPIASISRFNMNPAFVPTNAGSASNAEMLGCPHRVHKHSMQLVQDWRRLKVFSLLHFNQSIFQI
jgi:hypothetical protein